MSTRRQLLTATLALALTIVAGAAFASHSWGPYHWARQSNPFTLKLGDNVTSAWDSYLATTSSDWTQSTVLNTTIVAGQAGNARRCRPTAGRVEVCNTTYGNNGWLGIAGISITGGEHITQGYVKLNDTYFNTATYNKPAWRNLVMCQEVGHTLGLSHNDEDFNTTNGTCMDYSNDPNPNQHPDQHDYDQLEAIYAHLDSTTTVKSAARVDASIPAAMRDIEFEGIRQFGRLVSVSKDGHRTTFEADFGHGNKVVTHVFWIFDVTELERGIAGVPSN